MRYKAYVTKDIIQSILLITWIVAIVPGLIFWYTHHFNSRDNYYLFFDILILVLTVTTYFLIWKIYRRSRVNVGDESRIASNQLKIFKVPVMIITTFLITNCIPDVIYAILLTPISYNVILVMWSLGFVIDPSIYIFINKDVRNIAVKTVRKLVHVCRSSDIDGQFRGESLL